MMTRNAPICLDLDGCLAAYNDAFRDLLGSYGSPLDNFEQPDNPRMWGWYKPYGATQDQIDRALSYTANNPGWWLKLPRHRDFTDALIGPLCDLIRNEDVYVLTARPAGTRKVSQTWLGFWLTYSDLSRTTVLDTPSVVVTPTRKVQALVAIEPKAIVEDNLDTLQAYRAEMSALNLPSCDLILVDRAYNRDGDRTGLTVVASTEDAVKRLQEIG